MRGTCDGAVVYEHAGTCVNLIRYNTSVVSNHLALRAIAVLFSTSGILTIAIYLSPTCHLLVINDFVESLDGILTNRKNVLNKSKNKLKKYMGSICVLHIV